MCSSGSGGDGRKPWIPTSWTPQGTLSVWRCSCLCLAPAASWEGRKDLRQGMGIRGLQPLPPEPLKHACCKSLLLFQNVGGLHRENSSYEGCLTCFQVLALQAQTSCHKCQARPKSVPFFPQFTQYLLLDKRPLQVVKRLSNPNKGLCHTSLL